MVIIFTSNGEIVSANHPLVGKGVVGLMLEPDDELDGVSTAIKELYSRIARPKSHEQMREISDALHTRLAHICQCRPALPHKSSLIVNIL